MGLIQSVEQAWLDAATRIGVLEAFEAHARSGGRAVVLCYHGVRPPIDDPFDPNGTMHVSPVLFESHLEYLARACDVVPVDRLAQRGQQAGEKPMVAITFDDGYADNAEHALPLLRQYGCAATIFLPTAFIGTGRVFWWELLEHWIRASHSVVTFEEIRFDLAMLAGKEALFEQARLRLTRAGPRERDAVLEQLRTLLGGTNAIEPSTMSWDRVRELADGGLVSFGAHTVNHVAVRSLTDAELEVEIAGSANEVRRRVPNASTVFAYPYGRHADLDTRAAAVLRRNGFSGGVTLLAGAVRPDGDPYAMPRIFVERGDSVARLRAKIAGLDAPFWVARRVLNELRNGRPERPER
jgi:peptidoglycan/xylan/chitin deacetylase (PgdA/CDA1 family)